MGDLVLRDLTEGVAVVSLNRPEKHNAFSDELVAAWRSAVAWAIEERDARCILLRGEGPSFSAGRDLTELGQRAHGESDFEFVRRAQDHKLRLAEAPKPVVAALKGYVLGGALETALWADIRIAADDVQMGLPEIRIGILPDTGGTQLLSVLVGPARAKYLIMTGERVGAAEALAWGLVNEVVSPERLDERAGEVARRLAAGPPLALALAKQLVDQMWTEQVRRGVRQELIAQTALFASEDHREAKAARREDRPPRFRGR